ncbi:MAG: hypothetical protein ACRECX_08870 [Methyloceanibacter sp.]|uniref:hypothetical protein n=1 Tax=Methyloceanibacter sp. TaxID=1965321 RepID=UPI003D6D25CE
MIKLSYLLAALVLAASVASLAVASAEAQQQPRNERQGIFKPPPRGPLIGGTSWTLSDVWGEPEMPKPSLDYPAFNYPPGGYDLNGPPSQSPYPN